MSQQHHFVLSKIERGGGSPLKKPESIHGMGSCASLKYPRRNPPDHICFEDELDRRSIGLQQKKSLRDIDDTKKASNKSPKKEFFLFNERYLEKSTLFKQVVLERKMFVQYLLNGHWKGRLHKGLKNTLFNQLPPSLWHLEKFSSTGKKIFVNESMGDSRLCDSTSSSILEIISPEQLQAILIVCCLPSYFNIPTQLDLKCEPFPNHDSFSSVNCGLSFTDEKSDLSTESSDDDDDMKNVEAFLSNILQTIATEEELECMLSNGTWISHTMKFFMDSKSIISIWKVTPYSSCMIQKTCHPLDNKNNIMIPQFVYSTMNTYLEMNINEDEMIDIDTTCSYSCDGEELLSHRYEAMFNKELFQIAISEEKLLKTTVIQSSFISGERNSYHSSHKATPTTTTISPTHSKHHLHLHHSHHHHDHKSNHHNHHNMTTTTTKCSSFVALLPYYHHPSDILYMILLEHPLVMMSTTTGSSLLSIPATERMKVQQLTDLILFTIGTMLSFQY